MFYSGHIRTYSVFSALKFKRLGLASWCLGLITEHITHALGTLNDLPYILAETACVYCNNSLVPISHNIAGIVTVYNTVANNTAVFYFDVDIPRISSNAGIRVTAAAAAVITNTGTLATDLPDYSTTTATSNTRCHN